VTAAEPLTPPRHSPYSPTQLRTIAAAVDLFTAHGVSGTSLQMIADAVGVTKASIYYQFKTKDEIVLGVAEADLAQLEAAVEAAEAETDPAAARDVLLVRLVDLAVSHRHVVGIVQNDPVMVRLLEEHQPFQLLMERLYRVLVGDDPAVDGRVPAAMLSAAISGAVSHPLVSDLDDDSLRANLLGIARRFLHIPD
jgi:AcrR family transcriptional regulator